MLLRLILKHHESLGRWMRSQPRLAHGRQSFAEPEFIRLEYICDNEGMSSLSCCLRISVGKLVEPYTCFTETKMLLTERDGVEQCLRHPNKFRVTYCITVVRRGDEVMTSNSPTVSPGHILL